MHYTFRYLHVRELFSFLRWKTLKWDSDTMQMFLCDSAFPHTVKLRGFVMKVHPVQEYLPYFMFALHWFICIHLSYLRSNIWFLTCNMVTCSVRICLRPRWRVHATLTKTTGVSVLTVWTQSLVKWWTVLTVAMHGAQLRTILGIMTNLILLGSIRSISLSFFQKTCGVGEASTLHSRLTVSPSRALEFNSFWTNVGGWSASWAAYKNSTQW